MSPRPIKFRVWSKTWKSMHYADRLQGWLGRAESDVFGIKHFADLKWSDGMLHEEFAHYDPEHFVIEQFTGLLDSQGREIYEGDIVDFRTYGIAHGPESEAYTNQEVWFDVESGCWTFSRSVWPNCDEPFDYGYTIPGDRIDTTTFVVKGNVHESPELLKTR